MDKQANREHGPYCDAISGSRESVQCNGRTLVESWQTGVEWKHLAD